mgnify:CR=1 FL=1
MSSYNLKYSDIRNMILEIGVDDFLGIKESEVFKNRKLYEFCKSFKLRRYGYEDEVIVYI